MLVIELLATAASDSETANRLLSQASLWGQVWLRGVTTDNLHYWKPALQSWAGKIQIDVETSNRDGDLARELLNQGVARWTVAEDDWTWAAELFPSDRLAVLAHPPLSRDGRPKELLSRGNPQELTPTPPATCVYCPHGSEHVYFSYSAGAPTLRVREQLPCDQFAEELPLPGANSEWVVTLDSWKLHGEKIARMLWRRLVSDRTDGLVPTVVVDALEGVLGLVYSSSESFVAAAIQERGVYWSRSRQALWEKGATSGHRQVLLRIQTDCDRDALKFTVAAASEFCHLQRYHCFGEERQWGEIELHLRQRLTGGDSQSITYQLAHHPQRLQEKLSEETAELLQAMTESEANWECADLWYFSLIALLHRGGSISEVRQELARRMSRLTRRPPKGEIC